MLVLHIGSKNYSSWSLRPWCLMRQLGIKFDEKLHILGSDNSAFRKFSPSGKVPCLVDGKHTVHDSLAIAEYLYEDYPQVWPKDKAARAWARSVAAEMHSGFSSLRSICSMNCSIKVKLAETPAGLARDIARIQEIWAEGLSRFGGPFLAGANFTAVDAFYAPVVIRNWTYDLFHSPEAKEYCSRILALDCIAEWTRAGQTESIEEQHEADCVQYGKITQDCRKK